MVFEDRNGKILLEDEVNDLFEWEIEEKGIHLVPEFE
jgi:hypothetical protein